jgi:hypothetical protein
MIQVDMGSTVGLWEVNTVFNFSVGVSRMRVHVYICFGPANACSRGGGWYPDQASRDDVQENVTKNDFLTLTYILSTFL